ncbi:MAG: hypothetical protein AAGN64_13615 [Bacteroidota bacterium]
MLRYLDSPAPLRRYLEIKAEMKRLAAELADLEGEIYAAVDYEDDGKATAYGYQLEACVRRSYAYSDAVQALEKQVRTMKAAERSNGTAEITKATGFVRVTECPPVVPDRLPADLLPVGVEVEGTPF